MTQWKSKLQVGLRASSAKPKQSRLRGRAFTGQLKENGISISMDGKGRWRDHVFVERIWKFIQHEEVYLHACGSVQEARTSFDHYLELHNSTRPHSSLKAQHPIRYIPTACQNPLQQKYKSKNFHLRETQKL